MASIVRVKEGNRDGWKVFYYAPDNRRSSFYFAGPNNKTKAKELKGYLEDLLRAKRENLAIEPKTAQWLSGIDDKMRDTLASKGLIDSATKRLPGGAIAYCRAYLASRDDMKGIRNYRQAVDKLERFLCKDVSFKQLTEGDADRFHRHLLNNLKLSANTAGQTVKKLRQLARAAVKDRILDSNPFAEVRINTNSDESKVYFVSEADSLAILNSCPDQEWRVIFALCRWGGLRNPSETRLLRWRDINWERGRILVHSPKTAKQGKAERFVPLFPELKAELDSLFAMVEPGTEVPLDSFVMRRYRDERANLRTQLGRIAKRAGVPFWPKPFMALRSTRRTELQRCGRFASHVLDAWFGHTERVARVHYLHVLEADFQTATSFAGGSAGGAAIKSQAASSGDTASRLGAF